jgi:hypothetical protein
MGSFLKGMHLMEGSTLHFGFFLSCSMAHTSYLMCLPPKPFRLVGGRGPWPQAFPGGGEDSFLNRVHALRIIGED